MIKKCIFYSSLALTVAFISQGFKPLDDKKQNWFFVSKVDENLFPSKEKIDYPVSDSPFTGKSFTGFKEALAFKESQCQYSLVNSLGYMGKYQFGLASLKAVGIFDSSQFLNTPQLQEKAFISLLTVNKKVLKVEISKFGGRYISGILITESGILAAAHLGGAASVRKFLYSSGTQVKKDAFGTSIVSYLRKFSNYDTSFIGK